MCVITTQIGGIDYWTEQNSALHNAFYKSQYEKLLYKVKYSY